MIHRSSAGDIPAKPHTALRTAQGQLRYEHCPTWQGFDGPFTIMYREHAPHVHQSWSASTYGWPVPSAGDLVDGALTLRRHFLSDTVDAGKGPPIDARVPLLFNADVTFGVLKPGASDPVYLENTDGDDLYYIQRGGGTLRTPLGDVRFGEKD